MDTDNIKDNTHDENKLSDNAVSRELSARYNDVIFIDEKKPDKKKSPGDDVMLTQCILCLILVLSVFLLKFISDDFQRELLSIYKENTSAPAESAIAKIIETIEEWFKG